MLNPRLPTLEATTVVIIKYVKDNVRWVLFTYRIKTQNMGKGNTNYIKKRRDDKIHDLNKSVISFAFAD